MAYKLYVDTAAKCAFIRHYDNFDAGEGTSSIRDLWDNPLYKKGMNILRDTREVHLPEELTFEFFKKVAERIKHRDSILSAGSKFAWVVGNAKDFGYVHRWSISSRFGQHIEKKPFREFDKALEWLCLPKDIKINFPDDPDSNSTP